MKIRLIKIETFHHAEDLVPVKVEFWVERKIILWWSRTTREPCKTEEEARSLVREICGDCFYEYMRQGHSENNF